MSRRTERIESLIRSTIGELLLTKIADPRIEPALTSVTRVEMSEDLLSAKVFVSVMGTDAQQRNTLRALQHAAGHIQELMSRQVLLRDTPLLKFEMDVKFKKTLETLDIIQKAMNEIHQKEEQASGAAGPEEADDASPDSATPEADKQDEPE